MNSVVAFNNKVNSITENESDPITVSARLVIPEAPSSDAPITIGNSGKIHGASTVSIPAKIEIIKKTMLLNFC